jgi:hypothetical protein
MVLDVGGLGPGHRQVTGATDHLTVRLHQLRELCNRNILISVADPDPRFLGLLDSDPDSLVRGMDPDPDPSSIKKK